MTIGRTIEQPATEPGPGARAATRRNVAFLVVVLVAVVAAMVVRGASGPSPTAAPAPPDTSAPASASTPATGATPAPDAAAPACSGVEVETGDDLAGVVQQHGPGTTFCIAGGVHRITSTVVPRDDQRLIGRSGAVLDGGGDVEDAIAGYGGHQDRVVVTGLVIRDVTGDGIETGADWTVRDVEVHDAEIGIRGKVGARLHDNHVHHNRRYGIVINGGGRTRAGRIVLQGNEIAFNNTARHDEGDEGGTKLLKANGLDVLDNHVHDNYGNGLWTDADNIDVVYDGNLVEDNDGVGIFHEISYRAVIRNNTVRDNALPDGRSLLYGAQILVQNSSDVAVHDNDVRSGSHGIGVVTTDRGSGLYGVYRSADVTVRDNRIEARGTSGAAGQQEVTRSNVVFHDNTYVVPDRSGHWVWGTTAPLDWAAWQATGQDVDSTLEVRDGG